MSEEDDIATFLSNLNLGETPKVVEAPVSPGELSEIADLAPPVTAPPVTAPPVASTLEEDDPLAFFDNSGLKREREVPDAIKPWMKYHTFTRVKSIEHVREIVDACIAKGYCSLDLEAEGLDTRIDYDVNGKPFTKHKIVGFCICHDPKEGFYIPIRHKPGDGGEDLNVTPVEEVEAEISRLCRAAIPEGTPEAIEKDPLSYEISAPPKVRIAFWNASFDHELLYPVTGIDFWHPASFEDGLLAGFVVYAGDKRLGLKYKAKEYLRDPDGSPYEMIELKELFPKGRKIKFETLAPDEPGVIRYGGSDGICTYILCNIPEIVPRCNEKHKFTYRLEKQTSSVVRVMERNRVRIARDVIRPILDEQIGRRDSLLSSIRDLARNYGWENIDPSSPKQLSEFLFGPPPKGLDISPKPPSNEASGQYKTDADTLDELAKKPNASPVLKDIVEYRECEKFIGTYLENLVNNPDANDELRFQFKQTGAASGRFSAPAGDPEQGRSGVPVHGIPNSAKGARIRRGFVGRPGFAIVKADYSAEELRIAANVSGEPVWIEEFLHGSGDLHSITARAFFGKQEVSKEERNAGKIANFSLLYGGGPAAIVRATGCDKMEARRRKQQFDKAVPVFAKWIKTQHARVKQDLGVTTPFGRWLSIPDANHPDEAVRAACERHSVNYVIQGAGADIMKISMYLLHRAFHKRGWLRNGGDDSVRMLLTVHDEIVFEIRYDRVAEATPLIVEIMESPWRMPKAPAWKVPLVVEPLIGYNWASGYSVVRHKEGEEIQEGDYLINGYVYSTSRKAATNKDGEVVEEPDVNEKLDGKKFKLVDLPPWIAASLGKEIIPPTPVAVTPKPATQTPKPTTATPKPTEQAKPSNKLELQISQINRHTAEQVFEFVWASINREGPVLHLTDIVGTTLVPSEWDLRVDVDKLKSLLYLHNLLYVA